MRFLSLLIIVLFINKLSAQTCTVLGQNPSTAFPVCGVDTFVQNTVPLCGVNSLQVPGCPGTFYGDKNPFWYKFTCYQAGTLGFLITPNNLNDDYDWMLYDITGRSPNDVLTDPKLVVTGNWAGTFGATGASASGVNFIQCASDPAANEPSFAAMPTLIQGHEYLLLVSHFTNTQSGYKLSFGGGTAVITDPKLPQLQDAWAGCGGVTVSVKLNKKMKCNSLAANGSDFILSPANATITSAVGLGCNSSFEMDSLVLTMSNALPPGNYTITMQNGNDGNTLLDNCNRDIPAGENIPFTVLPVQPTPMDSITPVGCTPNSLQLVFPRPISCNSIAANGSDFIVNGPTPVTVTGATGNCASGVTKTITVQLAAPIQVGGNYQIQLVTGSDGNTLLDECGQQTPAGSSLNFTAYDTVNADFNYQLLLGCKADTLVAAHSGNNGVNEWLWNFNNEGSSQLQNVSHIFTTFGPKIIKLEVTNGVCFDSTSVTINLDNELKAAFGYPDVLCPEDVAIFTDSSIGNIISWRWDFGNGAISLLQDPLPQKYPPVTNTRSRIYNVQLIVQNNSCSDTAVHQVKVVNTCYITVPNAFTPNADGRNDFLYPLNAWKADNLEFHIYNRYGQLVFRTTDWSRQWDGTINGKQQSSGVFVWTLRYTDHDTGEKIFRKGTTVLLR